MDKKQKTWVAVRCSDDKVVIFPKKLVNHLQKFKTLSEDADSNGIIFQDERGIVVEKAVEYLFYKEKYIDAATSAKIPEFPIDSKISLELLILSTDWDI